MYDPRRPASVALALWIGAAWSAPAAAQPTAQASEPASAARPLQRWPEAVTRMSQWVVGSGDNGGLPFVVVDKVAAKVFVFGADGQLLDRAPALVGSARGDNSTPGDSDR